MSRSSYTASERRGVLIIAMIALLLIGSGMVVSMCSEVTEAETEFPTVVEHPEMIDSAAVKVKKEKESTKKKKKGEAEKPTKTKKSPVYRQRSPLDEPV